MAKEVLGDSSDPRWNYAFHPWEAVAGRIVDPKFVKSVGGVDFAPAPILRKPQPTPNEGASQSGTPTSNP
ncbi:MAG: hypothetical protein AAB662_01950 [Patescibacteria group bacterium]